MGKPKRHHYLPESYMRRFAVDDRIWVYDRQRDKVRRDTPRNVAVESEFYTTWTSLGSKETITEERLAELDHAGPIAFDKLERGKRLDPQDRHRVAFFLAFAETRGPSFGVRFVRSRIRPVVSPLDDRPGMYRMPCAAAPTTSEWPTYLV